jgi:7-cyano-7-deazaguanine synthase in queuosine biosynthesis
MTNSVLVLLSGGLDSATVLAMYRGWKRYAVGFDYGQLVGKAWATVAVAAALYFRSMRKVEAH